MSQTDPLTVLVVNEYAEEAKLVTISMRGFYPGCRIEVVYSSDEAIEWASKAAWQVILVEEQLSPLSGIAILPELRRRAPQAAIILQTERTDAGTALQVMQGGADYYLFKRSDAFLTELMIVTREALEKHELRDKLSRTDERYLRLVETLSDTVYELDTEGRFVYLSPSVTAWLGYAPEELRGTHFSKLFLPEQLALAERRFNDRRTGTRSARHVELRFIPKSGAQSGQPIDAEVNAKGLYDPQRKFLGTLGTIRDLSSKKEQVDRVRQLQTQLREADDLRDVAQHLSQASHDLQAPLATILADSQQLLSSIRDTRLESRLETLAAHASQAAQIGEELAEAVRARLMSGQSLLLDPRPSPTTSSDARGIQRDPGAATFSQDISLPTYTLPITRPDRRQAPRVNAQIDVTLTTDDITWRGTMANVGLGGAFVRFPQGLPALDGQPVYLTVRTAVSVLELHGIVRERREELLQGDRTESPDVGMVLEFIPLVAPESAVFASFLEGLGEQSITFTLEALAPPQEIPVSSDLRVGNGTEAPPSEQRQDIRVRLAVPARIESAGVMRRPDRYLGLTVNVSHEGACLQVNAGPEVLGSRIRVRFTLPSLPDTHTEGSEAVAPDYLTAGQVIWTAPDSTAPAELQSGPAHTAFRIGIRFHEVSPAADRALSRAIVRNLMSPLLVEGSQERTRIVSVSVDTRNTRGQRIVLSDDHLRDGISVESPMIIFAPGFGQTKDDGVALSYALVENGFRVLRYDYSNHLGESDGELDRATMSSMEDDLISVLVFAARSWPTASIVVLAPDLTGRVALKIASHSHDIDLLLLLNPILDVKAFLESVHHHDLISDYHSGLRRGVVNLLGYSIDLDHFLEDIVSRNFSDLSTTLQDVARLHTPVACVMTPPLSVSGGGLSWKPTQETIQQLQRVLSDHAEIIDLRAETAQPAPTSTAAPPGLIREVLRLCRTFLRPSDTHKAFRAPSAHEIYLQRRIEHERMRAGHTIAHTSRRVLWAAHLQHAVAFANLQDHWRLLDHISRLIGSLKSGRSVLDVGCGNGDLARHLLINRAYHRQHTATTVGDAPRYIGLTQTPELLHAARRAFSGIRRELDIQFSGAITTHPPLTASWLCADWDDTLPFVTGSVARVVCTFGMNFVSNPLLLYKELLRVLSPSGSLVLACWTSSTDLSVMYRDHLSRTGQNEFSAEPRSVLRHLATMKQALRDKLLHPMDRGPLEDVLSLGGANTPLVLPILAGQVLLVVVRKP